MTECTTVKMEPSPEIKTERDTGSEPLLMSEGEEQPVARAPAALTAPTDGPSGVKEEPGIDIVDDAAGTAAAKDIPAVAADGTTAASSSSDPEQSLQPQAGYSCNICNKQYKLEKSLRIHLGVHRNGKLRCSVCDKEFEHSYSLKIHMEVHETQPGAENYRCEICGKGFPVSITYKRHKKMHSSINPHSCTVCGKAFMSRHGLRDHSALHTNERPFVCDICGSSYKTKGVLRHHRKIHTRLKKKSFECEICGKYYISSASLNAHITLHTNKKQVLRCECTRSFASRESLTEHRLNDCEKRPFKCKACGETFRSESRFRTHLVKHIEDRGKCPVCKRRVTQLSKHMELHADKSEPEPCSVQPKTRYSCNICEKQFVLRRSLRTHLDIHKNGKIQCTICEKQFNYSYSLTKHMEIHNSGNETYPCEICGKVFSMREKFMNHKRTHSSLSAHKCAVCGTGFMTRQRLLEHSSIHTDERPFVCDICGLSYKTNPCLQRHRKKHMHLKEKPFECEICGKFFSNPEGLRVHLKIHTKQQIHKCHCPLSFPTRESLTEHQLKECKERPFKCAACSETFRSECRLQTHLAKHNDGKTQCPVCNRRVLQLGKHMEMHENKRRLRVANEEPTVLSLKELCMRLVLKARSSIVCKLVK